MKRYILDGFMGVTVDVASGSCDFLSGTSLCRVRFVLYVKTDIFWENYHLCLTKKWFQWKSLQVYLVFEFLFVHKRFNCVSISIWVGKLYCSNILKNCVTFESKTRYFQAWLRHREPNYVGICTQLNLMLKVRPKKSNFHLHLSSYFYCLT